MSRVKQPNKLKQPKRKPKKRKFVVDPDTKEIQIVETQRFLGLTDDDLDSAWNQLLRFDQKKVSCGLGSVVRVCYGVVSSAFGR